MAEQKKPIDSVPPPTDEIDGEWSEEEAPAKAASAGAASRAQAAPSSNEEEEDDEDEDEDEDDEEDEDEDEDDEEDEDEDEDEDEEDEDEDDEEEEDDEEAGATSSERSSASSASQDWLPDWAPWATLGGLLLLGLAGGLGLLPFDTKLERVPEPAETDTAAATATATATTTTTATASARRRTPAAANSAEQGEAISASHILIAYQGALRANPKVTRSKEEAKKLAEQVDKKAKSGADFKELVKQYSDEPRAAERGGDLGSFTRNRMVKPFADAAFELKVNQISDVVETPFGFHVIKRTK